METIKLWELDDYKKTLKFIANEYKEYTKEEAIKKLENNYGLHMRIKKGNNYILFGDVDEFNGKFKDFSKLLIRFLKEHYNLNIDNDDIYYTKNNIKKGSYHYSIPKYFTDTNTIYNIMENFKNTFEKELLKKNSIKKSCIDTSIYSEKWWRLPNQLITKDNLTTKHIIKKGTMDIFLVNYIPENSKNINNQKEIKKEEITYDKENPIKYILYNLHPKRFIEYCYWIVIYMIMINEKINLTDFYILSKLHYDKYDENKNNNILKNISIKKGYTISTLYFWLKEDNKKIFDELQNDRTDLWDKFEDYKNHSDLSKLYYNINPNKYIRSEKTGWYEYNQNNILIHREGNPKSLLNDITTQLQALLIEQRNYIIPKNNKDDDYNKKMKIFKNTYNKLGSSSFIKGVIDYLEYLYTIDDVDNLLDANINLFAFNNELYDNIKKEFRPIKPTDYITKTTNYNINKISNSTIRAELYKTLNEMFDDKNILRYHLETIALSMFGNKYEHFIINSSPGRSGKGVCSTLIQGAFGSYFYMADNTFLSTKFQADKPSPTKFQCKGIRYLLITEPEADEETKFNISFLKAITGNDAINCRDLNKSNITYKPQFTLFLQANKIPKLDSIDEAVKGRFRIIEFPFTFVKEPKKPNEKKIDVDLKSKINQEWYNEFILMLIEINQSIKDLETPPQIFERVNKYFEENNLIRQWLENTFTFTDDKKDNLLASTLLSLYNESGFQQMGQRKFNELLKQNKIKNFTSGGFLKFYGLKLKENIII